MAVSAPPLVEISPATSARKLSDPRHVEHRRVQGNAEGSGQGGFRRERESRVKPGLSVSWSSEVQSQGQGQESEDRVRRDSDYVSHRTAQVGGTWLVREVDTPQQEFGRS